MTFVPALSALIVNAFLIAVGIFGIGFLIGIHEFGHFIFCKLFNVRTPSFSIGYGPRLWEKKIGDTVFALSAIPFGGYVEIAGAAEVGQGEQKEAHARDERSFAVKPYWQKMIVMAGGVLFNFAFAYLTFILLFSAGIPKTPLLYPLNATTTITSVIPLSPADQANLQPGDVLTRFNEQAISSIPALLHEVHDSAGKNVRIQFLRNGKEQEVDVTIGWREPNKKGQGTLGALFEITDVPAEPTVVSALRKGISTTNSLISTIAQTLKAVFSKKTIDGMGGPLLIISETIKGASKGVKIFFTLLAFISINLAVLNLIPIPITDGGQALLYTIESIIRRPIPDKTKLIIHYICWVGIMILFAYLSIKDIARLLF